MSTFTQIVYHIIFSTKDRRPTLDEPGRERLFRYAWGIVNNHRCHLYRINAVEDHVHLLTSLHPEVALAGFVKSLKVATHIFIENERVFPAFERWQEGYGAFTHSAGDKDRLIEYIKGQGDHHRKTTFVDELKALLREAEVEFEEKYLT